MSYLAPLLLTLILSTCVRAQDLPLRSTLEIYDLDTRQRTVVYEEDAHFEAPNWSPDGRYLLLNSGGRLFKLTLDSLEKTYLETGFADKINNDHGISPDGRQIVLSHHDEARVRGYLSSRIYVMPDTGANPTLVTDRAPSFWHGWSPDGQRIAYTAGRDDNFDIYTLPLAGGEEQRLTDHPGLDDGPDYSPDGRYLYYNSMQSDTMEIWRMRTDGSEKEQLTQDKYSNWFPHPSPDGTRVVFLSYLEDQGADHPAMQPVALRLYDVRTGAIATLTYLTGGQGTINVPSWSPDGRRFAFVSYRYLLP